MPGNLAQREWRSAVLRGSRMLGGMADCSVGEQQDAGGSGGVECWGQQDGGGSG